MRTDARALIHKARDLGCEFYLIDGRWKARGPRNTNRGLMDLMDTYRTAINAELNRPKTAQELVALQSDYMLSRRPPVWSPKVT